MSTREQLSAAGSAVPVYPDHLRALVEAFPASLSQEELAERTGYSGTSGGFFGALAKLRTIELISGGKPALRASEDLF